MSALGEGAGGVCFLFLFFHLLGSGGSFSFFSFLLDNGLSEVTRMAEQPYVSFVRLVIGQILVLGGDLRKVCSSIS